MNTPAPSYDFVIIVFALTMGVAAALLAWYLTRAVAAVPEENREFRDPPPWGFRLIWWPIKVVSHYIEPLVSAKAQDQLMIKLRKSRLDYSISPVQFLASRLVGACLLALIAWWLMASFDIMQGRVDASGQVNEGMSTKAYGWAIVSAAIFGYIYPTIWLKDQLAKTQSELLKTFPFFLDMITLCVEAGLNMQGAMQQAVAKGTKGVIRDEIQRVLRDIRAGKPRAESLRDMAARLNETSVNNFVSAVNQAESMGMNLGPLLRVQADQRRSERFLRAEKLAMEAPVKMLLPLIAFIFPCTFIVLFFPLVMKFMHSGF
jgi:tight adherence protein C